MTTITVDGIVVRPAASLPPKRIAIAGPGLPEVIERFDDEAWQLWDEAVGGTELRLQDPTPV